MNIEADVLIIGTGISGLYTALHLREDLKILLLTKAKKEESNTYLAQGGIAVAKGKEDIEVHIEDTMKAGKYKNKPEAVRVLVEESMENIPELLDLGVQLDRENGELAYTKEAAHSTNRIIHAKDETGKAVAEAFLKAAEQRKNITIMEDTYMLDLLTKGKQCCGAIAFQNEEQMNIFAKVVVLATGGVGGIFKNSTNQRHIKADGIYVALKHDIQLKDLEYIQFHPTAFYDENQGKRRFLISESLRGEGGKLTNIRGERFVDELLPRDIVAEAILREMEKTKASYVYLDISVLSPEYIMNRFPGIYRECLKAGVDITKQKIPVSPAQHYFMGGIDVDLNCKTTMDCLYAVGETSCTGVHGANRLASNSLLEGLVFSKRAAREINEDIDKISQLYVNPPVIEQDIKILQKEHLQVVIDTFKRKAGRFNNELVSNR